MSVFAHNNERNEYHVFSDGAIAELQEALDRSLESRDGSDAPLRPAVERLCAEGRKRQLDPEKMIIALKAAWEGLTVRRMDEERKRRAYERMFSFCLETYFGARRAR